MRLHSLSATAFGPFADTVHVDFDTLSDAGLFLLTGDTGAGKTSVLDAVCFALYGDVPGDRGAAKRLRSDQAPPHVAPQVVLEASLAGRRFRFVRSPAWQRPKKRGTGTTTQHASVTLTERVDGEWQLLSSRLDEVGDLVSALLGMNLPQFCQVAMLPQGRFQAFLRARSDERHAVLQQLFRTSRYSRMEGWLREHRLDLQRRSQHAHDVVAGLVNRVSEASSSPCPEHWDLRALHTPATDGEIAAWAERVVAQVRSCLDDGRRELPAVLDAEGQVESALAAGRRVAELRTRHDEAQSALDELVRDAAAHAARVQELSAARRAAAVFPLVTLGTDVRHEATAAQRRVDTASAEAREHLRPLGASVPDPDSPHELARLRAEAAAARQALVPLDDADERLASLSATRARCDAELEGAQQQVVTTSARLDALPAQVAAARTRHDAARRASDDGREAALAREAVQAQLSAHAQAAELSAQLDQARLDRARRRDEVHALTERWLDLREARLQGMAAEIAGGLVVGGSCPVCGSCEHPRPASTSPDTPDAAAERAALRAVDDAKVVLQATDDQVAQLHTRWEVARAAAGERPSDALASDLQALDERVRRGDEAKASMAGLESALAELDAAREGLLAARHAAELEVARLEVLLRSLTDDADSLAGEVDRAVAGTPFTSVAERARHLERTCSLLEVLADALGAAQLCARQLTNHEAALAEACARDGFADVSAVLEAHRDEATVEELVAAIESTVLEESRLRSLLADPDLRAAAQAEVPDLDQLATTLEERRAETQRLRTTIEQGASRVTRLQGLVAELDAALSHWAPLRADLEVVAGLASFAEGKSADNTLQMRLSAYVLAYRLSQVVDAANSRLSGMSDQRYSLEHTGRRGAGETRGGLSLLVRDDWSGEARDPATLSGGETFVVSLALALGLADVITQEAGGADLDTLFVDEGFGSLDADTLDGVLDTLDSLRDGGRVVGVVSHVTEMRERIPAQLRVLKGRSGSTLVASGC